MEKVSVIVPLYNAEKYLKRCLDSIICQTYSNLEIIVIDDFSSDDSYKTALDYSKLDSRIKVYKNKVNSGAGFTRNFGLSVASGDYISFIDSDDYIENNFVESMLNKIIQEKSDMCICDIFVRYPDSSKDVRSKACTGLNDIYDILNNGLVASPCNKLFKKKLFDNFSFCEGIMNEDVATIIPILILANKISYVDDTYYNYNQNDESVQNSRLSEKRLDIFKAIDVLESRIRNLPNYNEYMDIIIFNQIILFFLYVIPKEKNFWIRWKFLRKFKKCANKYDIKQNRYLWRLIDECGKKHKLYYKLLFKLYDLNLLFLDNLLISFYQLLRSLVFVNVIKKNIDLDDIVKVAKKQHKMKDAKIKVSVVVPNYNYAKFIYERIYSILNQDYKIYELIILDDKSSDNSIEVINVLVDKIKDYVNVKTVYNDVNSGTAFKQWEKGFEYAKGNYVWIAEADDYCSKHMLKTLIKPIINNNNIRISYVDTAFIDKFGNIILTTIKNEIDIQKSGHYDSCFVSNGLDEIKKFMYLNCTIANVSSCLIKNDDYKKFFDMSSNYKQAGDWLFYVNVASLGDIAYNNKVMNYYRLHGSNVSSTTKYKLHIDEINKIHSYIYSTFNLNNEHKKKMKERINFLKKVWNLND